MNDVVFGGVTPYLSYPDGDVAAEWLQRVFGFGPVRVARAVDGSWSEGELRIGSDRIDISGGRPGNEQLLIVAVDDADAMRARIMANGVPCDPAEDAPYGPRTCHVTDPWGYRWYFWQGEARYS